MKNIHLLIIAFIITSFICPSLYGQGTVENRSFYSPSLGVTKNYKIYLPPEYYQSVENYPVVYFFRNRENEWFSTPALHLVADGLIDAGLIGNMILVGPNSGSNNGLYYGCVNMLRPDLAPSGGIGTGKFEDYIVNDLIAHIDTTFRTIADKEHRGIDGFSMGGFISTVTSLRNPEVFSSIGSFDGSLMFYNLEDPGVPGTGPDDWIWMGEQLADPIFDVPRNIPYMLLHSVTNILELADTSTLNQFRSNRYHISHAFRSAGGNYWRNKNFIGMLNDKGIRNSWGNPLLHDNFIHTYGMAKYHATASLIKHWQTFNSTKISAPTLIDFSITESTGKMREVEVFNYGPGNLTITNIQISSGEFSLVNLPSLPVTLQPYIETLTFSINFIPSSDQPFADTAYIYSDDPFIPIAKIILRGKGGSFKADPGILYAASGDSLYFIQHIGTDSMKASVIGAFGNAINYVSELSVNPVTKELYAFGQYDGLFYDLDLINTKGGEGFYYQYIECETSSILAATFGKDSLIYISGLDGMIYSFNSQHPYNFPPLTLIAETGLRISALAFNYSTEELWAVVNTTGMGSIKDKIYRINISTGDTTYIGSAGLNKIIDDIVFDSQGILYGLVGTYAAADTLITINTTTGIATKLGPLKTTLLFAIAISPESPDGIVEPKEILHPANFYLAQNYPNPFNPSTTIKYNLRERAFVELKIYDILGREIEVLVNEEQNAGYYAIEFNAGNLASGIYFYHLKAGDFVETKKMILLK